MARLPPSLSPSSMREGLKIEVIFPLGNRLLGPCPRGGCASLLFGVGGSQCPSGGKKWQKYEIYQAFKGGRNRCLSFQAALQGMSLWDEDFNCAPNIRSSVPCRKQCYLQGCLLCPLLALSSAVSLHYAGTS